MNEFAAISAVLASLNSAADLAKVIRESKISLENAETRFKVAELISMLASAKIDLADVQALLLDKEERIRELRAKLELKSKLVYEAPSYWIRENDHTDGPFCQRCYDSDTKLIRLQGSSENGWLCRSCKVTYRDDGFKPKPRKSRSFVSGIPVNRV